MITKEQVESMIKENGATPYKENEDGEVFIKITDGYGIATTYRVKNKCPKCGATFTKIGETSGCYDGEFTSVDNFSCENKCCLSYQDIRNLASVKKE
jgi:hypothetical protein